jgi:hypothetical protein
MSVSDFLAPDGPACSVPDIDPAVPRVETRHDFCIDLIVTPERVISCDAPKRPAGSTGFPLSPEQIAAIPALARRARLCRAARNSTNFKTTCSAKIEYLEARNRLPALAQDGQPSHSSHGSRLASRSGNTGWSTQNSLPHGSRITQKS